MRFNDIIDKARQNKIIALESFKNYTYVIFEDGEAVLTSYTKKKTKILLLENGLAEDLVEINRGVEASPNHFKRTIPNDRFIVSKIWWTQIAPLKSSHRSYMFEASRRKLPVVMKLFQKIAVLFLFVFSASLGVTAQLTAVNDDFTGCSSVYSSEKLNLLLNDMDSRNEIEGDSAAFEYPVYETAFVDSLRNLSGGAVVVDSVNRQIVNVKWTNGTSFVDSLTFEYRIKDTVGTVLISDWALVTLVGRKSIAALGGSYSNTTTTIINGCRSLNRGKAVFESGSKYEVRMTNSSFFGPGTEIKAGSVVLIEPD